MTEPSFKVCFVISEAEPLIKVGGLGDVGGTLPGALTALPREMTDGRAVDVRVVIPFHDVLKQKQIPTKWICNYKIPYENGLFQDVYVSQAEGMEVPIYLIDGAPIRGKGVYSSNPIDDAYKYIFFSAAADELFRHIDWIPDVLHAHDWHAASSVMKMKQMRAYDPKFHNVRMLYTIHNLPYAGLNSPDILEKYGIEEAYAEEIPSGARGCPMSLGLSAADMISTVSETYAKEILTDEFGHGYQYFLQNHKEKVTGIVNGIIPDQWNPAIDRVLYQNFDVNSLEKKAENKRMLQAEVGLPQRDDIPLIIMIGRLDVQKGFDLAFAALRKVLGQNWQALILGSGNPKIQNDCLALAASYPDRVRAEIRYDAAFSRKMYAGGDMLLMPSRYEPCGIAQMIAMLYGCIPIAHSTGGLKDTITDPKDSSQYTGFLFDKPTPEACSEAVSRALTAWNDRESWETLQKRCMVQDFTWEKSAKKYYDLYKSL